MGLLPLGTAVGAETPWNPAAASAYLEQRQQVWNDYTSKTAKKGNLPQKEYCISCHTGLPYVLARPALEKTLGQSLAVGDSGAMVERLRYRVQHLELPPYYDAESMHSRAFESVLYALALTLDDRERHLEKMSPVTELAFQNMWAQQTRTGDIAGSWGWEEAGLDPWGTPAARYFGTTIAILAVGYAPADYAKRPELRESIELTASYLRNGFGQQTAHDRLAALWADSEMPGLIRASDRDATLEEIRKAQNPDGGWSPRALGPWKPRPDSEGGDVVTSGDSDGYETAFAACCLEKAGLPQSTPEIRRALSWLATHQDPATGAWTGKSLNGNWNSNKGPVIGFLVTDAATAYAFLALSGYN